MHEIYDVPKDERICIVVQLSMKYCRAKEDEKDDINFDLTQKVEESERDNNAYKDTDDAQR